MIWRVILRVLMIIAGLCLFVGSLVTGVFIALIPIAIVAVIYNIIWGKPQEGDPY